MTLAGESAGRIFDHTQRYVATLRLPERGLLLYDSLPEK
jgi:hypothetical protein